MVHISNFTLSTRRNGQIHNLKIQDTGCRHFGFLGYVKKNVSSSGLDEDICIKFYGIMHWRLAYTTACTVDHGLYGSTSCSYSLNYTVQKVAVTTLIPNLVGRGCWATGAPQKRCGPRTPYHVLRTLNGVRSTWYGVRVTPRTLNRVRRVTLQGCDHIATDHIGHNHIGHSKTISATAKNHIGHTENQYRPHRGVVQTSHVGGHQSPSLPFTSPSSPPSPLLPSPRPYPHFPSPSPTFPSPSPYFPLPSLPLPFPAPRSFPSPPLRSRPP